MILLALDPGTYQTAWMVYDTETKKPIEWKIESNEQLINKLPWVSQYSPDRLVIETIVPYKRIGFTTIETIYWIGRFTQSCISCIEVERVSRPEVKKLLCGSSRKKDKDVREELIEIYGEPGTKKNPGGTYGISKDVWSCLALAHIWTLKNEK